MNELNDTTAVILAGGLGTRLKSIVPEKQKVMASVKNRPFITYLLEQLNLYGIQNVVICIGYKGEEVISTFGNNYKTLKISYSEEKTPLGTGGALRLANPLISSKEALVMNGDSFCDVNIKSFYRWHCSKKSSASIVLTEMNNTDRYGRVISDEEDKIITFEEKKSLSQRGWINAGIYLFNIELITSIVKDIPVSLEKEIFPLWIKEGLYGYKNHGKFIDIGTPESYSESNEFFNKPL